MLEFELTRRQYRTENLGFSMVGNIDLRLCSNMAELRPIAGIVTRVCCIALISSLSCREIICCQSTVYKPIKRSMPMVYIELGSCLLNWKCSGQVNGEMVTRMTAKFSHSRTSVLLVLQKSIVASTCPPIANTVLGKRQTAVTPDWRSTASSAAVFN